MQKDLKTGLLLGLALAGVAVVYLATRSGVSIKSRLTESFLPENSENLQDDTLELEPENSRIALENKEITIHKKTSGKFSQPQKEPEKKRYHIVVKGETLSSIANIYYGRTAKADKIFNANKHILKDPDVLTAGTRLFIPD